jgi:hypothetical protein
MFSIKSITSLSLPLSLILFVFPSPQPVIQVNYTGCIRENQAQHLKQSDINSNQASEQDQLSVAEIHQADRIDDHRVIGIISCNKISIKQRSKIARSILVIGTGKDAWCKISISWFREMERSRIKSSELMKFEIAIRLQPLIKGKI